MSTHAGAQASGRATCCGAHRVTLFKTQTECLVELWFCNCCSFFFSSFGAAARFPHLASSALFVVLLFIDWTDGTKAFFFFKKRAFHTGVTALCCHVDWFQTMSTDSQTAVHAVGLCQSASLFLSEASCVCMSHCYLCIMPTTCSKALWLPLQWPWLTQKPRG